MFRFVRWSIEMALIVVFLAGIFGGVSYLAAGYHTACDWVREGIGVKPPPPEPPRIRYVFDGSLVKQKENLIVQQETQNEYLQKSVQNIETFEMLHDRLAESIAASEKNGSPIVFAGRSLTHDEAREQFGLIHRALEIAKEDHAFRIKLRRMTDVMITEIDTKITNAKKL